MAKKKTNQQEKKVQVKKKVQKRKKNTRRHVKGEIISWEELEMKRNFSLFICTNTKEGKYTSDALKN